MDKLDLQRFAGSLTLTVKNDGNFSATSASPSSSLAKDDKSTLTITPSSGYELDEIVVIEGGATVLYESDAWKVKMGESNATVFVKGKKNNVYKIAENCLVNINGTVTNLQRNMTLQRGKSGAIVGVDVTGTEISLSSEIVSELVKSGVLIKI